jgi:cyclopropane fatty-acyl-phospholipid synthase-like methyltransferase
MFERCYGSRPRVLREDFCGTAALARAWVEAHRDHRAVGVDLDPEPLAWGREHHLAHLKPEQADRLALLRGDVRRVRAAKADVLVAFNFSYCVFRTRPELGDYFRRARSNLGRRGIFVLDAYGGSEAQERREERRSLRGFTYVWDQDRFDPITHHTTCHIHFEFPDGSRMQRAFTYQWRLWTLPELRELLAEAGFASTEVYWEGTERRTNEPNGIFRSREHAPEDPAWVAYLVAAR